MIFDLLCPGDWRDSYESRMLGEMVWNREVSSMHDVLLLLHEYFRSHEGKRDLELWGENACFGIYLDGNLVGDYYKGMVLIHPIIDLSQDWLSGKDINVMGTFRHGHEGYALPIETCLHYGINSMTVKPDPLHKWK